MANTGIIQGQDLVVYVDGSAVAHSTNCVFTPSVEVRDRVSKDTGKYKTKVAGLIDWEVSADGLACYGSGNYFALYTKMLLRAEVDIKFAGRSAGDGTENYTAEADDDYFYSGHALITALPLTAPNNADATFSITLAGTGEPLQEQAVIV